MNKNQYSWCFGRPRKTLNCNITKQTILLYNIIISISQNGAVLRILYYTIQYYTIQYYTILYYTILYYTILYYTILYYTILYYAILYCVLVLMLILNSFPKKIRDRRGWKPWDATHPYVRSHVNNFLNKSLEFYVDEVFEFLYIFYISQV